MFFGSGGVFIKSAAIDLGTVNTLIAVKGRGILLREPTAVAMTADDDRSVIAAGIDAIQMAGRTPGGVRVVYPMANGVVTDYRLVAAMLKLFLQKITGRKNGALGMRLALALPLCATEVEKRAIGEAAKALGAREVLLLDEPVAAAIGAELPVFEPVGSMIADIGGGTTDIAVLALGGTAASSSERVGGRLMDKAISDHLRNKFDLAIGERTAEYVKLSLASALPGGLERMEVRGRNTETGLPGTAIVNSAEISRAVAPVVRSIIDAVKATLAQTPPELAGDLLTNGITLTGGGSLLPNIGRLIAHETGLTVRVDECPLDCVALGAMELLSNPGVQEAGGNLNIV